MACSRSFCKQNGWGSDLALQVNSPSSQQWASLLPGIKASPSPLCDQFTAGDKCILHPIPGMLFNDSLQIYICVCMHVYIYIFTFILVCVCIVSACSCLNIFKWFRVWWHTYYPSIGKLRQKDREFEFWSLESTCGENSHELSSSLHRHEYAYTIHTHTQNEYVTDENQKQRLKKYFNCVGETKEMKRKEKAKKGKAQGSEWWKDNICLC